MVIIEEKASMVENELGLTKPVDWVSDAKPIIAPMPSLDLKQSGPKVLNDASGSGVVIQESPIGFYAVVGVLVVLIMLYKKEWFK